jgi:hypothetical protein
MRSYHSAYLPVGGKITFRQNRIMRCTPRRVIIIKMNVCAVYIFPFEAQTAGSFYCVGSIQKNLPWLSVHSKQKAGALKTTTNKKSRETVDLLLHYSPGGLKSSLFYISSRRFAMFYLFLPRLLLFSL